MRLAVHVLDRIRPHFTVATVSLLTAGLVMGAAGSAQAATATVPLGSTDSFGVLAATAVSNVPQSVITGDVGVSPAAGSFITGLTCDEVDGAIYSVDASGPLPCRETNPGLLTTARSDQTVAYGNADGRVPDNVYPAGENQLGGKTLPPGVYEFGHAPTANLIGDLTLHGDADSVWIFQATSDLVTAASSTVTLTGGAQACNIFWQVDSQATLGADSTFVGTVSAGTDVVLGNKATVEGRVFAAAAVTLDMNTISRPGCTTPPPVVPPVDEPPVVPPSDQPPVVPPSDQPPVDQPPTDVPLDRPAVVPPAGSASTNQSLLRASQPTGTAGTTSAGTPTGRQVTEVPTGPVAAGDGSTSASTGSTRWLLLGTVVLGAAGGTALAVARQRRHV
jgi:hypothetical protein